MGCGASLGSSPAEEEDEDPPKPKRSLASAFRQADAPPKKLYSAYIAYHEAEAATEAAALQAELELALDRPVYLDGAGPRINSETAKEAVKQSDVFILLQSARVLEQPYCLVALLTAIDQAP